MLQIIFIINFYIVLTTKHTLNTNMKAMFNTGVNMLAVNTVFNVIFNMTFHAFCYISPNISSIEN